MIFHLLHHVDDPVIPLLTAGYRHPEVLPYLSIDEANYWHYVTSTPHVQYYALLRDGKLLGGLHCEWEGMTLYLALLILPEHQHQGVGTEALQAVINGHIDLPPFDCIEVDIDIQNTTSLRLFDKAGFCFVEQLDELCRYVYTR